jgi:hypothetical protein
MKKSDKFLIGIVVVVVLLIVVALVITLTRPEPSYQAEDTPESVAANYLLALQKRDYNRAYFYLSPTLWGYPKSVEKFTNDITQNYPSIRLDTNTTLSIKTVNITDTNATITVLESRFQEGDLFNTSQSSYVFEMRLLLRKGEWEIVNSTRYFAACWTQYNGCK